MSATTSRLRSFALLFLGLSLLGNLVDAVLDVDGVWAVLRMVVSAAFLVAGVLWGLSYLRDRHRGHPTDPNQVQPDGRTR